MPMALKVHTDFVVRLNFLAGKRADNGTAC